MHSNGFIGETLVRA